MSLTGGGSSLSSAYGLMGCIYFVPFVPVFWIIAVALAGASLGKAPPTEVQGSVSGPATSNSTPVIANLSATTVYAGASCPSQYSGRAYGLSLGWYVAGSSGGTTTTYDATGLNSTAAKLRKALIAALVLVLFR